MTDLNTSITFEKQFNGYNKEQVDCYVANLADAYQMAYDEYYAVCEKYNNLLNDYKNLEEQGEDKPDAEVITRALIESEAIAKRIVADANAEAEKIMTEVQVEARKLKEKASNEEIRSKVVAQKIIEEANIEAAVVRDKAKRMIDEARLEAEQMTEQAKKVRRQTEEYIKQSIVKIQRILTSDGAEIDALPTQPEDEVEIDELQILETPVLVPLKSISIAN